MVPLRRRCHEAASGRRPIAMDVARTPAGRTLAGTSTAHGGSVRWPGDGCHHRAMTTLRLTADRLIDGTGEPTLEGGVAVLVEDDRIVAAGPDASVPSPESARRLAFP